MYNATVTDHFSNPRHIGTLDTRNTDVLVGQDGVRGGGNYMTLYLRVGGDQITEARFQTYGCPAAIASGSWVAEWVVGKTPNVALSLEAREVEQGLGGLPLGKEHCALLAVNALRAALAAGKTNTVHITKSEGE
jgi:NifU-like protein involved in Fe-S cluster formation